MRARDQAIVEMARQGRPSYRLIGERFGLTPSRVGQILRKHGEANPPSSGWPNRVAWRGGRIRLDGGYIGVLMWDHPRANPLTGYVREHILIVERALGRPLPPKAVVHHVNETKDDNGNRNLVACEDTAYHCLLHQRMRARAACGHAGWMKCRRCPRWDAPENLYVSPDGKFAVHPECQREYRRRFSQKAILAENPHA